MALSTVNQDATGGQHSRVNNTAANCGLARDENRDALILQYLPLVRHVVRQLSSTGTVAYFEKEDLVSYGTIGLIQAIDRFDADRGPQFIGYATHRIRGAIIDAIRTVDPLPRGVRRRVREIDQATDDLTARLGRQPTATEVQEAAGVTAGEYDDAITMRSLQVVPLETSTDDEDRYAPSTHVAADDGDSPCDAFEKREMLELLAQAVECLPEREKRVIALSFSGSRTLAEIGNDLGVSASRVSQLRARGVERIRSRFVALDAA